MSEADSCIPLDQGTAAAQAVERYRAEVVDEAAATIYARMAAELEVFGERGREHCRADLHHHLDYIAGSLVAGEPFLFGQYLLWLHEVLTARGVPGASLALSVDLLRDALGDRLPPAQFNLVAAVLEGGRDALRQPPHPAHGLGSSRTLAARHASAEALAESLVQGDQRRCEEIVAAVTAEQGYVGMAVNLVQPALYRIGDGWKARQISVAQEHVATALAQRLLVRRFVEATPAPANGHKALFACVPSNQHALGLRIVADAFELDGWEVDYLGADTPTDSLVERIREVQPDLVGLSVALIRQLPVAREVVKRIREACADSAPRIIAGGGLDAVPNLAERIGVDGWYGQPQEALGGNR